MTTRRIGRVAAAALGSAVALLALGAPATAAPQKSTSSMSITAERLVLEPTDRGYVGTVRATVTNEGPVADYVSLTVIEPAGASFHTLQPGGGCGYSGLVENRIIASCAGDLVEAGGSLTFELSFHVWTTTRDYAMIAKGGSVAVVPNGASKASDTARFTTLFRSTTGSLRAPKPYVQSVATDVSIRGGDVVLNRQSDGSWLGRMPVTVRYGNDAPSFDLPVEAVLPAGVVVDHIEPQDAPSWWTWFSVPGGRFMPGEERTFDVILAAPAETAPGVLGNGSYTVSASYLYGVDVQDVDPADNTTSFTVTAAEAG